MKNSHEAKLGWACLVMYIIAYDIWAMKHSKRTLSQGFTGTMDTKLGRLSLISVWAIVTKHLLFSKVLPKLDAIGWAASKYRVSAGVLEVSEWTTD